MVYDKRGTRLTLRGGLPCPKLPSSSRTAAARLSVCLLIFRFTSREVFIRKDPKTGDVILSRKPGSWDDLFALADSVEIPADFLASRDRRPPKNAASSDRNSAMLRFMLDTIV